ncbi:MAG: hypothetical protein NVSMB5_26170 [Candidatus Velthaea sp.]
MLLGSAIVAGTANAALAAPAARPVATPSAHDIRPSNALPAFVRIWASKDVVRGGDVVLVHVMTTTNVASVEARIANNGVSIPRDAIGSFRLEYTVPSLPWFFHGRHDVEFIARNTAGARVSEWRSFVLE